MVDESLLARRLSQLGYFGILQQEDAQTLELASDPAGRRTLLDLVADSRADAVARFLAAELLFAHDDTFPDSANKAELAGVYATALKENFTDTANTWGLPGLKFGLVGQHALALGPELVPAFRALLDDDTPLDYEDSEEASIGHTYRFRVKDVAAALVAAAMRLPFDAEQDPGRRDAAIKPIKDRTAR